MAHECPKCGLTCYCGGDIDDLCLDDHEAIINCTHYLKTDCDGYERDEEYYEDDIEDFPVAEDKP